MSWTPRTKTYPWSEDRTLDELFEALTAITELRSVDTITISKSAITVREWVQDSDPILGSDPPSHLEDSVVSVLQSVDLREVSGDCGLKLNSIARVAQLMLKAKDAGRSGVAWAVGSNTAFAAWLGLPTAPSRFMDILVEEATSLPDDKLVLLCARSRRQSLVTADIGFLITMETEDA